MSHAYLLYNGFTLSNSEKDMKDFVSSNVCRRASILSSFPKSSAIKFQKASKNGGCKCCDVCAKACECQSDDCSRNKFDFLIGTDTSPNTEMAKKRSVTDEERDLVESKMLEYKESLQHAIVPNLKTVSYPNVLFLFTDFQVSQVRSSCEFMFTIEDVNRHVEIWRKEDSHMILKVVREVFDDINEPLVESAMEVSLLDDTDREEGTLELDEDWMEIQDDSEINISNSINLSEIEEDASEFDDSLDNLCKSLENYMSISGIKPQLLYDSDVDDNSFA